MRGDATVVEYLNKGLRHELTAVNQYWLHYRLLENWGYNTLAKIWRKESIEEMEHADKLVHRIIFLDGFPNMQVLDPCISARPSRKCSTATSPPKCPRARSMRKRRPIATPSRITSAATCSKS
jgi:bacterioferritin